MMKKKWFVPVIAAIAVIFTALMLILVYPKNKMPKSYTEAKDGVVFIASDFGSGSGFAIGENGKDVQYIVTNCHVVMNQKTGEKANQVIVYFSAAANRYMVAQIYRYDISKDVCVLRLPEPTGEVKPLKIRKYNDNDLSQNFYALGYPARATAGTDFERYDKSEIVTTSGMISRRTMVEERDVYMLDLEITHGNSGGPLVNKDGEVVGINTFSIVNEGGEEANYAVCIDELTRLIGDDEISYTLTTDKNKKGIVVVVIVVLVDIVLIAVILIALLGNKSPKTDKKVKKTQKTEKDDYSKTVAVSDDIAPTVAVAGGITVITCVSGAVMDQEFVLKDKLVFGRDPKRCTVVLPVDAEGVSGLHCQVTLIGSKVMLKDLGSTYGTFINDGLKIDKDTEVELSDGDTFCLGSEKTKFSVSIG